MMPGYEEIANGGLGDEPVDHEGRARRDEDAQIAAGGDRAKGQLVVVAVLAHLRQGRLVHDRRGRDVVTADGAEGRARTDSGHGQATPEMPHPFVEGVEGAADGPPLARDDAHHDEQRDDHQDVVRSDSRRWW